MKKNLFTKIFGMSALLVLLKAEVSIAQLPSLRCASPSSQVPLTKARLIQLALASPSTPNRTPELRFETFALRTIVPGVPIPNNQLPFPSNLRFQKTTHPNGVRQPVGNAPIQI